MSSNKCLIVGCITLKFRIVRSTRLKCEITPLSTTRSIHRIIIGAVEEGIVADFQIMVRRERCREELSLILIMLGLARLNAQT